MTSSRRFTTPLVIGFAATLAGCGAHSRTPSAIPKTAQEAAAHCSAPDVAQRIKDVVIPSAFAFKGAHDQQRLTKEISFSVANVTLTDFQEDTGETECRGDVALVAENFRDVTQIEYMLTPSGPAQPMALSVPDDAAIQRKLASMAAKLQKP